MNYAASSLVRLGMACLLVVAGAGHVHAGSATHPDLPEQVFAPEQRAPLVKVEVFPSEIQLTTARDRQSIVVQATFADGITRDVTQEAAITPSDGKLLRRVGAVSTRG